MPPSSRPSGADSHGTRMSTTISRQPPRSSRGRALEHGGEPLEPDTLRQSRRRGGGGADQGGTVTPRQDPHPRWSAGAPGRRSTARPVTASRRAFARGPSTHFPTDTSRPGGRRIRFPDGTRRPRPGPRAFSLARRHVLVESEHVEARVAELASGHRDRLVGRRSCRKWNRRRLFVHAVAFQAGVQGPNGAGPAPTRLPATRRKIGLRLRAQGGLQHCCFSGGASSGGQFGHTCAMSFLAMRPGRPRSGGKRHW